MNILMISRSVYEWDVRVRREARALSAAGHQVVFMGLRSSLDLDGDIELVHLEPSRDRDPNSQFQGRWFLRAARWFLLPEHRARIERRFARLAIEATEKLGLDPDVVHAHDYPALAPATEIANRCGSKLVYDAHEYWSGRPRRGRPEPIRRWLNRRRESALAQTADAVIMVSEHGARLLEHALGVRGVWVIRNTFPSKPKGQRAEKPVGAVYAGRIAPQRDLDTVFAAQCWRDPDFSLHVMGAVDEIALPSWVAAHPMGTMEEVDALLADVGMGLVTMTNRYINHRIALPNKLCQAISVGVPVVATNAPQTAAVVTEHGLGALYEPGIPDSFDRAIAEVVEEYQSFTENVLRSQHLFDWQVDADRLVELYRELESAA